MDYSVTRTCSRIRLQPNPATLAHQIELWTKLILDWARHGKVFMVNVEGVAGDGLGEVFENATIRRKSVPTKCDSTLLSTLPVLYVWNAMKSPPQQSSICGSHSGRLLSPSIRTILTSMVKEGRSKAWFSLSPTWSYKNSDSYGRESDSRSPEANRHVSVVVEEARRMGYRDIRLGERIFPGISAAMLISRSWTMV